MKKIILSLSLIAGLVACGSNNNNQIEEVQDAPEELTQEVVDSEHTGEFQLNVEKSIVNWEGSKVFVETVHHGTVQLSEGSFKVENGLVVQGKAIIDLNTIANEDVEGEYKAKIEGHLKSEDFFYVEKFPTAQIDVKSVSNGIVQADLTIRGKTKSIEFPAEIKVSENELTANATIVFNRTDFGVMFGSSSFVDLAKDKVIKDEITIKVQLVANK